MSELYKGWIIYSKRIGYHGEWAGEAVKDDQQMLTGRFAGKGAKDEALKAIKVMVDKQTAE